MKTKEISFTLPMMIVLIEVLFFSPMTKRRSLSLAPFLLTLLIIPFSRLDLAAEAKADFTREAIEISRLDYLRTQFRVIMTYIRLLFLPVRQNLDYDYPIYHSFFEPTVFLSFLVLSALFGAALFLLFRAPLPLRRLSAFGILWFFLTLSVESSIIPIRDVILEHRLYLPSVGFFFSCVTAAFMTLPYLKRRAAWMGRPAWGILIFSFVALSFSLATFRRNEVWGDRVRLWEDVVKKSPRKTRGHDNLGSALSDRGKFKEAADQFSQALAINPRDASAHNSLGVALDRQGRSEEALGHYFQVVEIKLDDETAHYNLGDALQKRGRIEEAVPHYLEALRIRPDFDRAHNNLGVALGQEGKLEEAELHLSEAARITPGEAMTHYNLRTVLFQQGKFEEAILHLSEAARINPNDAMARYYLGLSSWKLGRSEDALREFEAALRINPKFSEAHESAERIRRGLGQ